MEHNVPHVGLVYGLKKINIMITKEEIVEILCNHGGYMDRSRTEQGIHEDNFQDVADAILSKLNQHDVSGRSEQLVCDRCGSSKIEECGSNEYSCEDCGHFPITN